MIEFFKISENKILKKKNNILTKIILTLEPFRCEELEVTDYEPSCRSLLISFNQKVPTYDYEILEKISMEQVQDMFKSFIENQYKEYIKQKETFISLYQNKIKQIENFDFVYDAYAKYVYSEKNIIFAVKKDNCWYEILSCDKHFELTELQTEFVETEFLQISKEEFSNKYKNYLTQILYSHILSREQILLEQKKNLYKLTNIDFSFILS